MVGFPTLFGARANGVKRDFPHHSKLLTQACRTRVRFVYEGFDQTSTPSGETMTLVIPEDGKGTVVGK